MNGNNALLDSNIIINISKGILDIENILTNYKNLFVSIITYIEVLGFKFKSTQEKAIIEDLLNQFELIHLTMDLAKLVIAIREKRKIKLPDAIILASAQKNNCDLLTFNIDDFVNIDTTIKIIKPN